MTAISSLIASVAPQAPSANAAAPAPASPRPNEFAKLLSRQQAQAEVSPRGELPDAKAEPAVRHEAAGGERTTQAAQNKDRIAARGDKPRPVADKPKTEARRSEKTAEASTDKADKAEGPADDAAEIDPALADWLSALNWPLATPEAAGKGTAATGDAAAGDTALLQEAAGDKPGRLAGQGRETGHRAGDAHELTRADAQAAGAARGAATGQDSAITWQAAAEQASRQPVESPVRSEPLAGASAVSAPSAASPVRGTEAPGPVAVATPVQSAEFPQALGLQISMLARDGVQEAELHLNPAEMGPISVQIALDGTQAQVDFGADMAATRQIIENSLPELAAALRDAGFTLTGGGVHQQARDANDGGGSSRGGQGGDRQSAAGEPVEAAARRVTARVSAGGVDLYA